MGGLKLKKSLVGILSVHPGSYSSSILLQKTNVINNVGSDEELDVVGIEYSLE